MLISESFWLLLLQMIALSDKAHEKGVPVTSGLPVVCCKAFEDNLGTLELACLPKMQPGAKHINPKYHQIRETVAEGRVSIKHVTSKDQLGDALLTKNFPQDLFILL
jgi:hypothetical protein